MKAIILCGGYATRLYPLTLNQPKALLPILGKPIIEHIINKIPNFISDIFVVTNDKYYLNFVWWLNKNPDIFGGNIKIVNDSTTTNENRLGGIGDLNFVIESEKIDEDILVLLGDNLFDFELNDFVDFFYTNQKTSIGIFELDKEKAKRFGVVEIENNLIKSFEEKPENPATNLVSTGIYIFPKSELIEIKNYMKTDLDKDKLGNLVKYFVEKGVVYGYKFEGNWYDIGSVEEYTVLR